jgi:hypothetical protein
MREASASGESRRTAWANDTRPREFETITKPTDSPFLSGDVARSSDAERGGAMTGIEIRRFERADESRTFEHGSFEVVTLGGVTIGRASYEPGWIWSEHVGQPAGEELCQVEHVGFVVSGRTGVKMADGTEAELTPGDLSSRSGPVTTRG